MSKVKFGENDSLIVELQQTVSSEKQQADDAIRKATRMQRRIRAFYDAIEYVSFSSAEEAPIWATNWLDWLLDGVVPVPDEVEESAPEDQPEPDFASVEETAPEDQPDPPAPTAAVA